MRRRRERRLGEGRAWARVGRSLRPELARRGSGGVTVTSAFEISECRQLRERKVVEQGHLREAY